MITFNKYTVKHNLKLIKDGAQVGETIRPSYTKDDYSRFLEDGTDFAFKR